MSHANPAQARGDLGFIPNNRFHAPNRNFFGSPGNPSKKGVALYGQLSKMQTEVGDAKGKSSELTGDGIISKRTEWLEGQERKLTATINETRGDQQRLAEQIAASMGDLESISKETKRLNAEHDRASQKTQQLYEEQQWVYGCTAVALKGILCSDKVHKTLEDYRKSKSSTEINTIAPANKWVMLSYPMERVELDNGYQYLMRVKMAHPKTGQLSICWAVVYEEVDGKEHRIIKEFDMVPHP